MSKVTATQLCMLLGPLICTISIMAAEGQLAEEVFVPEPTELHAVASADGSKVIWSKPIATIESADATVSFSAVEIEGPDGDQVRGVFMALEDSDSTDELYVTDDLLPNLRSELQELEFTRQFDDNCQAKHRCIHGIARCRPSQTEEQAYCPGRYWTANSERGFLLSTAGSTFWFPSVAATQFDAIIGEAEQIFE